MQTQRIQFFPSSSVRVRDSDFANAMRNNRDYLLRLEPDRLLALFRREAGLLSHDQMQAVLSVEHGGMAESLAEVWNISGEARYLELARKFRHNGGQGERDAEVATQRWERRSWTFGCRTQRQSEVGEPITGIVE